MAKLQPGHELCEDHRCATCYESHCELEREMHSRLPEGSERWHDILGEYRAYLENTRGIFCETEFGWADERFFDQANVEEFLDWLIAANEYEVDTEGSEG